MGWGVELCRWSVVFFNVLGLCVNRTERWVWTMLAGSRMLWPCRNISLLVSPMNVLESRCRTTFSGNDIRPGQTAWAADCDRPAQPVGRQKATIAVYQLVLGGSAGWTEHPTEQLWRESSSINLILTVCVATWQDQLNKRQKEFCFSLHSCSQRESSLHWRDRGFILFQHLRLWKKPFEDLGLI